MNSMIYVCFKTYHSCMNNMWTAHPAQGDNKKAGCKCTLQTFICYISSALHFGAPKFVNVSFVTIFSNTSIMQVGSGIDFNSLCFGIISFPFFITLKNHCGNISPSTFSVFSVNSYTYLFPALLVYDIKSIPPLSWYTIPNFGFAFFITHIL